MDRDEEKTIDILKGAGFALGAFFLFTVMNTCAKLLNGAHHSIEIGFYRNLVGTLVFLTYILFQRRTDLFRLKSRRIIIFRAFIGSLSLVVTFAAFQMLPMANAQTLLFTTALLIPVAGFVFLGEKVGRYRWAAIAAGFAGVLLITGPSAEYSLLGVALALFATTLHTTIGIMLRYLGQRDNPLTVTFYFLVIGLALTALPMPWIAHMPSGRSMLILLLCGLSGTGAQLCLAHAYVHMQAALMGILSYSSLIWATLFGWLFWGHVPGWQIWTGGIIIIASNLFIVYREHRLGKRKIL